MQKKVLDKQFMKFILLVIFVLLVISVLRLMTIQFDLLGMARDGHESLASKLVRSFDLVPLFLCTVPYCRARFYDGVLRQIAESHDLSIGEFTERYHLEERYFRNRNGKWRIKVFKQGAVLRELERGKLLM